jgi:hypothetical protein
MGCTITQPTWARGHVDLVATRRASWLKYSSQLGLGIPATFTSESERVFTGTYGVAFPNLGYTAVPLFADAARRSDVCPQKDINQGLVTLHKSPSPILLHESRRRGLSCRLLFV